MSWRGKREKTGPGRTFQAPPGFRDSDQPAFALNEVVSSAYQVRSSVARVETGQVMEAWDMLLERPVALKVAWRDPGTLPLLAETRVCAAVADEGAVGIYGLGNHRGVEYVIAERVGGMSVREYVNAAGGPVGAGDVVELLLRVARALAAAHNANIAIGEVSGETVLVGPHRRVVLGRLSMSQVPSVGTDNVVFAPEVVTAQRSATDPLAAIGIDLYGLGCLAIELALGRPPFVGDTVKATLFNHVHQKPPVLSEVRNDVPVELGDLVNELLAKQPAARPPTAETVLRQLEAIAERAAATRRQLRVLVVDDDQNRVRDTWSVVRRAHARATVDAARDGHEAVAKLRRDRPDVVIVDTRLQGSMNALELLMYVHGLEEARGCTVVTLGERLAPRDAAVFAQVGVTHALVRDAEMHEALMTLIRQLAGAPNGRTHGRTTITG